MSRPPVVSALALTVGALWWWAVLRLVLVPAESGAVEGAVAVGGWGLGLLPVHCVPAPLRRARLRAGRDALEAGDGCEADAGGEGAGAIGAATRASTPHRSDAGSGPS
ncbi:hypothetical protein AB0N09_25975 [Streptomyces erythrochromogenes]|uniref:hypothetical protein n=1 Tax=Streptomyces erythrochromogenes TaxID=285574 RepID=UPI0034403D39